MALSEHQAHPNPNLLFDFSPSVSPIETFVFLSYLVIPRHPPDTSSGLTIAAISSPMLPFSSSIHSLTAFSWIASLSLEPRQARTGHRRGVVLCQVLHWSMQLGGSPAFLLHFHGQECSLQSLELLAVLLRTCANFRFFSNAYHIAKTVWFLTRREKGTYPVRTGSRFQSFSKSRSKLGVPGLLNETE